MPKDADNGIYPFNALQLKAKGFIEEANRLHEEHLLKNPMRTQPIWALAGNYHLLGRVDEAMGLLRRIMEIDPNHFLARYTLAVWHLESGNEQEALDEFIKVALQNTNKGQPEAECGYIAQILWKRGDRTGAIKWLEKLVVESSGSATFKEYALLMQMYVDMSCFNDAIQVGQALIKRCPNYLKGYLLLANILSSQGHLYKAKDVLQRLIQHIAERTDKAEFRLHGQDAMLEEATVQLADLDRKINEVGYDSD